MQRGRRVKEVRTSCAVHGELLGDFDEVGPADDADDDFLAQVAQQLDSFERCALCAPAFSNASSDILSMNSAPGGPA